jgi:hypothetical protein
VEAVMCRKTQGLVVGFIYILIKRRASRRLPMLDFRGTFDMMRRQSLLSEFGPCMLPVVKAAGQHD